MSLSATDPHEGEHWHEALGPASEDRGKPGADLAKAAARRDQAVRLRLAGLTYEQIAVEAGYSNKAAAAAAVQRALNRREVADVDRLRALENARYDRAQMAIWTKVLAGDIKALDAFIRLSARRARLNGLDAPQEVIISAAVQTELTEALSDLRVVIGEVVDERDEE